MFAPPSATGRTSGHRRLDMVAVAGWLAVLLGLAVVAGWILDVPRLKGVAPNFATMKINAALCFLLGGLALLVQRRAAVTASPRLLPVARALALLVAVIGLLTAFEYLTGVDLGIDEMLLADPHVGPLGISGRMSVITAVCFVLFGAAMMLPPGRRAGMLFSLLCTLGLLLSFLAAVGYLYNVRVVYQPLPATSIALHSAGGLLVLFLGALQSRPGDGWIRIYLRPGSVGLIVRALVPVVVLLPVLLGWLGLQGVRADLYGPAGQTALVVTACSLLLAAVTLAIARRGAMADDALREQRQIYRSVVGNSLDAFIMMDVDGRVLDWNAQAERVFGWSREEALGRPLERLVVGEDQRDAHRRGLARFLATGEGPLILSRTTVSARRRDGAEFPAELIVVPICIDGHWRFGGFVRDVSAQLATEEQLRQSQRMDAIGQLTGGIAHDLNNLLTVVIGNLDLLLPHGDDRTRRHAEPALRAAERGAALVHRLLAFSRRQALAPERLDVNALVIQIHELIQRTLGEEVDIELQLAHGVWPVFADPGQVESALLNLVVNARDAMPDGGRLTIETCNAGLDLDYAAVNREVEPGDYVMLAVTDTGTGMTPEVLTHAFEPFFTTKEVGKGSGLGLSMIYGFAKQSRGHVKIYSEPGVGTTVRLYLPRHPDPAPQPGPVEAAAPRAAELEAAGETILVVEDDAAVRGFVVASLERLGYRVLAAADGRQALAVLAEHPDIDLLFTDVVIPGGTTGRQLAESAQQLRPGLKVLYTSGYTRNSIVHQGKLDPEVAFLAKPYRREELAAKLRSVLGSGQP